MAERVNAQVLLEDVIIDDKSLAAKAADLIRDKIISGECPMGSRLPETEFAAALGVSRASIREAFMILENDGLLVRKTNRSTAVAFYSPEDARNLCEMRLALEDYCVQKCMSEHTLDVDALEEISAMIEYQYAQRSQRGQRSNLEWIKSDMRFHESFIIRSGNPYALETWRMIRNRMSQLLYYAADRYAAQVTPQGDRGSHERMLQLMVGGDRERVTAFLRRHILESGEIICESLAENNISSGLQKHSRNKM